MKILFILNYVLLKIRPRNANFNPYLHLNEGVLEIEKVIFVSLF